MPDTVEEIAADLFALCNKLKYVDFSSSVTGIEARAFNGCSSLRNVTLPQKLDYIGAYCFYNSGLTSINLPDSTRLVEWHYFEKCMDLKTVTFGKGLRIIGELAFSGCAYLNTIYWNANPGSEYCNYENAFNNCGTLGEPLKVVFGDNVSKIPDNAMETCHCLTEIAFPETLVSIGKSAFAHCWEVKSVTIPQKVSFIGGGDFNYCKSLETIYWNAEKVNDFAGSDNPFPRGGSNCKDLKVVFGNTVKSIPSYALFNCLQVNEIIIGENVERIGENAFFNCNIKELLIPNSVTAIEAFALINLNNLTDLIIPDSVKLSERAIAYCKGLKNLTLPSSIDYAHVCALKLGNLENVYISDSSKRFQSIGGILYGKDEACTLEMIPAGRTDICILSKCTAIEPWVFEKTKLQKISVDNGNTAFCLMNGALYSHDKNSL